VTDLLPALEAAQRAATCHPKRRHYARGLCTACYDHHRGHGTLAQFPRERRPTADFVEDYTQLRAAGLGRTQIAERLGRTRNAIDLAYSRAVRAGLLTPDRRTT
jgi:hypothetical protein